MKDSSTAQNILATGISTRLGGQAVSDVVNSLADLNGLKGGTQSGLVDANNPALQKLSTSIASLGPCQPMTMVNFAEIHIYEASVGPNGMMQWTPILGSEGLHFDRTFLGAQTTTAEYASPKDSGQTQSGKVDPAVLQSAISGIFGQAPVGVTGTTQSAPVNSGPSLPPAVQQQVQVDCDDTCKSTSRTFNLFNFGHKTHGEDPRAKTQNRVLRGIPDTISVPTGPGSSDGGVNLNSAGRTQSGTVGPTESKSIFNQPILNQPTLNQPENITTPQPSTPSTPLSGNGKPAPAISDPGVKP
jgi:hypothetical protein